MASKRRKTEALGSQPADSPTEPPKPAAAGGSIDHDLLREEYFHLQRVVEDFDTKSLTIKSWSVTLSMAGIGAAYFQNKPIILVMAALSALLFWIIEGLWKSFQYGFYARVDEIERYYAGELEHIVVPRISRSWSASWHGGGVERLLQIMQWPHVFLPHAIVLAGGLVLYVIEIELRR